MQFAFFALLIVCIEFKLKMGTWIDLHADEAVALFIYLEPSQAGGRLLESHLCSSVGDRALRQHKDFFFSFETHLSPLWLKLMVSAPAALGSILLNPYGGNYGDGRIISAHLNSPEMLFYGYTGANWVWVWTCHMMKGKHYGVGAGWHELFDTEYWQNNGIVPLFSPWLCSSAQGEHGCLLPMLLIRPFITRLLLLLFFSSSQPWDVAYGLWLWCPLILLCWGHLPPVLPWSSLMGAFQPFSRSESLEISSKVSDNVEAKGQEEKEWFPKCHAIAGEEKKGTKPQVFHWIVALCPFLFSSPAPNPQRIDLA